MRCVDKRTVSTWRATCEVIEAIDGKVQLTGLSSCQPTHFFEIAVHFRRKAKEWNDGTKREIAEWVERCEAEEWTVQQLRQKLLAEQIRPAQLETCKISDLRQLIDQGKKFGAIYADPPWKYGNQATRAATDNHYPTMTVDEIAALPIGKLAADQCHLHLWTTNGFLFECPKLMAAWGFEYKSVFVWCKPQFGIGNYWRVAHEFLLLGVRGSLVFSDHSLRSWSEVPRGEHSEKPDAVRLMIEKASPGPRLELFARVQTEGWTAWGNQVQGSLYCPT